MEWYRDYYRPPVIWIGKFILANGVSPTTRQIVANPYDAEGDGWWCGGAG